MKKIIISLAALVLFSATSYAQQEAAQKRYRGEFNLFGGPSFDKSNYSMNFDGNQYSSRTNFLFGGQILVGGSYLSIGFEVNYSSMGSDDTDIFTPPAVKKEIETSVSMIQYYLAGKITANPNHRLRLYFPFGAGLVNYRAKTTVEHFFAGNSVYDEENSLSSTKPILYGGVGLEYVMESGFFIGIEGRYTTARLSNKFSTEKNMNNIDALFKFGMKF